MRPLFFALWMQALSPTCGAFPPSAAELGGAPAAERILGHNRPGRIGLLRPGNSYDPKFSKGELPPRERKTALRDLLQAYLTTFNDLGVETWLMHGALLSWWRAKHGGDREHTAAELWSWEPDISMQLSEPGIYFLAAYYNMSTFYLKTRGRPNPRRYLLQLSPHARERERIDRSETAEAADARWIDTETGLFINIFAVRYSLTHPGGEGMLTCKDGSELMDTYLFPLQKSTFEGVPVMVPYRHEELLVMEYGPEALQQAGRGGDLFL